MPMPHRTQMQVIQRRLTGKEGADRLRELNTILKGLPNYKNGPYADIRKWVAGQIDATRARARVVQRDSIAVRREGVAQTSARWRAQRWQVVAIAGAFGDSGKDR